MDSGIYIVYILVTIHKFAEVDLCSYTISRKTLACISRIWYNIDICLTFPGKDEIYETIEKNRVYLCGILCIDLHIPAAAGLCL